MKFTAMTAAHTALRPLIWSAGRVARSAHAVAASDSWMDASVRTTVR